MPKPAETYEHRDASPRAIFSIGAGLAVTVFAILFGIWLWLHWLGPAGLQFRSENPHGFNPVPGPQLQVEPSLDLERLNASDREALHSYRWIDRRAGVVQIPIERAMDLTAEKGVFR